MTSPPWNRKPQVGFTTSTDIRLRYLEWDGNGSPVVLLHGLTVCAEYWSLVARYLATEHRVLAVDLRGHGLSDKPDWGYDYPTLARDVEQLCKEAKVEGALVAGHSWGAGVALTLAASYPGRASHLALVEGGLGRRSRAEDDPPPDYSQMMAPLEIYRTRETYLQEAGAGLQAVMAPEIEEVLMTSVTVNQDGSISERLSRENHIRILQAMRDLGGRALLQTLRVPALFVVALSSQPQAQGRNERKQEGVEEARKLVPVSRVEWFPDTAHDVQLHRPREVARALEDFIHGREGP